MKPKAGTGRADKARGFQDRFLEKSPLWSSAIHCQWRYVLFLNYGVDPKLLASFLPQGTELDLWQDRAWLSLVGLTFKNAKAFGVPLPFKQDFEQIHLRFYVQRREGLRRKRGVVFLREVVAKPLISPLARILFNEKFDARETAREIHLHGNTIHVSYRWAEGSGWSEMEAMTSDASFNTLVRGTHEEFICHRHWSYRPQRTGGTRETHVFHPRWQTVPCPQARLSLEDHHLFDFPFTEILRRKPDSAFLAQGSAVRIGPLQTTSR